MKIVLLAFRPTPPLLSAVLPVKLAGTVAARNVLPAAGVVTDAVVGAVLSYVWVGALPVQLFTLVLAAFVADGVTAPAVEDVGGCGAVPELLLKLLSPP